MYINQKVLVIWPFFCQYLVILIPVRGCILIHYDYLSLKMRIIKVEIFFDYLSCITHVILSSCDCIFHTQSEIKLFLSFMNWFILENRRSYFWQPAISVTSYTLWIQIFTLTFKITQPRPHTALLHNVPRKI